MRRLPLLALLPLVAVAVGGPLRDAGAGETPAAETKVVLQATWVGFEGLADDAAAAKAAAALTGVPGVREVTWTVAREEAKVVRVEGQAGDEALGKALAAAGVRGAVIPTRAVTLTFRKKLHCPACVLKVQETTTAIAGTKDAEVAEDRTTVRIVFDPRRVEEKAFREALATAGYPVTDA